LTELTEVPSLFSSLASTGVANHNPRVNPRKHLLITGMTILPNLDLQGM
jgi:hypothetical protein